MRTESGCNMFSPSKLEKIKAEIERLEAALRDCNDSGLREIIENWIMEKKKKLSSEQRA